MSIFTVPKSDNNNVNDNNDDDKMPLIQDPLNLNAVSGSDDTAAASSSSSAASSSVPSAPPPSRCNSSDDDDDNDTEEEDTEGESEDGSDDEEEEEEGENDDDDKEIVVVEDSDKDDDDKTSSEKPARSLLVKPEPMSDDSASFTVANSVPSAASSAAAAPVAVALVEAGIEPCRLCGEKFSSALMSKHEFTCKFKKSIPTVAAPNNKKDGDETDSDSDDDDDDGMTLEDQHNYKIVTTRDNPFEFVIGFVNSLTISITRQIRILSEDLRQSKLENKRLEKAAEEAKRTLSAYTSPTLRDDKLAYGKASKAQVNAEWYLRRVDADDQAEQQRLVREIDTARQKRLSTEYGRLATAELDAGNAVSDHWNAQVRGREKKITELGKFVKHIAETQTLARDICAKKHKTNGQNDIAYLAEFQALTNTLGEMLYKAALVQLKQAEKALSGGPSSSAAAASSATANYNFRAETAFSTMLTYSPNIKRFCGAYEPVSAVAEDDMTISELSAKRVAQTAAQTPLYETVLALAETNSDWKEWLQQSIYGVFLFYRIKYMARPSKAGKAIDIKVPRVWADYERRLSALEYFLRFYLIRYTNKTLAEWYTGLDKVKETEKFQDANARRNNDLAELFDYFCVGRGTVSLAFKGAAAAISSVVTDLEYRHGAKLLLKAADEKQNVADQEKRERVQLYKQKEQIQRKEERQTKKDERKKKEADEKRAKQEKEAQPHSCPLVPSPASSSSAAAAASSAASSASVLPPALPPSLTKLFDELYRFAVNVPGRSIDKKSSNGELHFSDWNDQKKAYTYFKSLSLSGDKKTPVFMYDFNRVRVFPAALKGYTIQCAIYHYLPEKADYFLGVLVTSANGAKKTLWFSRTPPNEDTGECPENGAESLHFAAVYNNAKKKKVAPSAAAPSTSAAAAGGGVSISVVSTTTQSTSTTTTTTTAQIVLPTPVPVSASVKRPLAGQQTAADPESQPTKRLRPDPAKSIDLVVID